MKCPRCETENLPAAASERLLAVPQPNPNLQANVLVVFAEVLIASDAVGERPRIESSLTEADIAERIVARPGCGAPVSSRCGVIGHAAPLAREFLA